MPEILKNWIVKNLLLAIGLLLALVLVSALFLNLLTRHGKELVVPDFTNMKISEATYTASVDGMRIEVVDSVYIRRMGRGLVYSQNPKPGSKVKKGRRILLTINSVTPKKVQMPNLVGYSMRQAKAELSSRGLALGKLMYVSDIATNNVLRQLVGNMEITPGRMIESGTAVNLVVGLNSSDSQTYIPDVKGLKYLRAVDVVHDNSLNIKRLVFDESVKNYSDSLDAIVVRQGPEASMAPIVMGSDVTLYLSVDPAKTIMKK
ncbi:MAG: PASTA domain-containing protein [Bacteroidales bacterium]|nr:PASTA domain-containing protein [Bacteroidales bacterium]MBQ2109211.1 PASTA domain-containing protein [Bacteroidales bacterium]MBQ2525502.1 PASTA domain-containing protein [Bacteroidales bacterium]MBQ3916775.1 PASTA domain-containing protein [Bacteroidales bacterium]MBR6361691.1 PASTA domain-containing protein [Bacteroidales bacterium]